MEEKVQTAKTRSRQPSKEAKNCSLCSKMKPFWWPYGALSHANQNFQKVTIGKPWPIEWISRKVTLFLQANQREERPRIRVWSWKKRTTTRWKYQCRPNHIKGRYAGSWETEIGPLQIEEEKTRGVYANIKDSSTARSTMSLSKYEDTHPRHNNKSTNLNQEPHMMRTKI